MDTVENWLRILLLSYLPIHKQIADVCPLASTADTIGHGHHNIEYKGISAPLYYTKFSVLKKSYLNLILIMNTYHYTLII